MNEATLIEMQSREERCTVRQRCYRDAIVGTDQSDIPESIAHEFIQGRGGRREVLCAHTQVTQFLGEAQCGGNARPDMEMPGVEMGLYRIFRWLTDSMEALEDFEGVRAMLERQL